jgi:hypothetical protein
MVNNFLGVVIGAEIDRDEGGSKLLGAAEGYMIEAAIKAVAPIVATFALGCGVRFLARRAYEAILGEPSRS